MFIPIEKLWFWIVLVVSLCAVFGAGYLSRGYVVTGGENVVRGPWVDCVGVVDNVGVESDKSMERIYKFCVARKMDTKNKDKLIVKLRRRIDLLKNDRSKLYQATSVLRKNANKCNHVMSESIKKDNELEDDMMMSALVCSDNCRKWGISSEKCVVLCHR